MAVIRPPHFCPTCGGQIYERHLDQSNVPLCQRLIGDTFIGWDYEGHVCDPKPPLYASDNSGPYPDFPNLEYQ